MPKENEQVRVVIGLDDLCKMRADAKSYHFYYQQYNDILKEKSKLLGEIADLKKELAAEVELVSRLKVKVETLEIDSRESKGKRK